MNYRDELFEKINDEFPELIRINASLKEQFNFVNSNLLPFLFYQNSKVQSSSFINVYTAGNNALRALPLAVVLGFIKPEIDRLLSDKDFANFIPAHCININHNGTVSLLEKVNYSTREIIIKDGGGKRSCIAFSNLVLWKNRYTYGTESSFIIDRIKEYLSLCQNVSVNPLSIPFEGKIRPKSGVVVFTNKSKFKSILNSLMFKDGSTLKKYVNIQELRVDMNARREDSRKYVPLSQHRKVCSQIPLIIIAQSLDRGLLKEIKEDYPHITTVVFDEFEKLTEEVDLIRKQALSLNLNLFTIQRDSFCSNFSRLSSASHWLLNYGQKVLLNEQKEDRIDLSVCVARDIKFNELFIKGRQVFELLKNLWEECPSGFDFSKLVADFWKLHKRLNSFYDLSVFKKSVGELRMEIDELEKGFDSVVYKDRFRETYAYLDSISLNEVSVKQRMFEDEINGESLLIVANFFEDADRLSLERELKLRHPRLKVIHFRDYKEEAEINRIYDTALFCNFFGEYRTLLFLRKYGHKTVLVLNNKEYDDFRVQCEKMEKVTGRLSSEANIMKLLKCEDFRSEGCANYSINGFQVNYKGEGERKYSESTGTENPSDLEIITLDRLFQKLYSEKTANGNFRYLPVGDRTKTIIYLDDGACMEVDSVKRFYAFFEESLEKSSIKSRDLKIEAARIKEGMSIFRLKGREELEEIIDKVLQRLDVRARNIYEHQKLWRDAIRDYMLNENLSSRDFVERLQSWNFNIVSPVTVDNWLEGITDVPNNFNSLLNILYDNGILATAVPQKIILKETQLYGRLKELAPKEVFRIYINQLRSIPYETDFNIPELIERVYDFVDIRTVCFVYSPEKNI